MTRLISARVLGAAFTALAAWGAGATPAVADRQIGAAEYLDKLRGMWFGQLIGNHTGRSFEGLYLTREAAPDSEFEWVIKTDQEDPWTGDDDTSFEYLYLHALETCGISPTLAQIQDEWDAHVPLPGIYFANRQAKYLMNHGFEIPDTGAFRYNMHAYAIDSQIATESIGAFSPGRRQWTIDSLGEFASVSNEGFPLHAAQFYGAMYAVAAFESDVGAIVVLGQLAIPQTSRSWSTIQDVRDWYAADLVDGTLDWRETRRLIYDYYRGAYDYGRYRNWAESTINLAITTMALLYGQGDFEETIRIGVLAGFDADCNAATAGGLVGLVVGYEALPAELTETATDYYQPLDRPGLPTMDTITNVAARMQAVTEQVIVADGGTVADGVYTIPADDPVSPDPELPDPNGPTGLVSTVLDVGGTVTVAASIEDHEPLLDRDNLESIIDGIVDIRYDGHLPYDTYDGENPQPPGGDYFQLNFSVPLVFEGLTFYEGDVRWNSTQGDPRVRELRGGYFNEIVVEIYASGEWSLANNLALSEPLDAYAYYQVIDLSFDAAPGTAVRVRGEAGGTHEYTSIVELVAHGTLLGDLDRDGDIDLADLAELLSNYGRTSGVTYEDGDLDFDGDVDLADLAALLAVYGTTSD